MSDMVCHVLLVLFVIGMMIGLARTGWWTVMHL